MKRKHNKIIIKPGDKFNRLTAIKFLGRKIDEKTGWISYPIWLYKCDCGKKHTANGYQVYYNKIKSCGCLKVELWKKRMTKHGHTSFKQGIHRTTPTYNSWVSMKQRVYNKKYHYFEKYRKLGVVVCSRWKNSFVNFLEDMGERPSKEYELGRYDITKGFYKENCYWGTYEQIANNRLTNRFIKIDGEKMTFAQACRKFGLSPCTINERLKRGFEEDELLKPIGYKPRYFRKRKKIKLNKNKIIITKELMKAFEKSVSRMNVLLSILDNRERDIIKKRFGVETGDKATLQEIATEYGLTRERIRQIEDIAIKKMDKLNSSLSSLEIKE